jgi:hypothetical protein
MQKINKNISELWLKSATLFLASTLTSTLVLAAGAPSGTHCSSNVSQSNIKSNACFKSSNWKVIKLKNKNLKNVTFKNVGIKLSGTNSIENVLFENGKYTSGKGAHYLSVSGGKTTVKNSVFKRTSTGQKGRGMSVADNATLIATGNRIKGYFITGINGGGINSRFNKNTLIRSSKFTSGGDNTDHGHYANGYKNIKITNSTMSGWEASPGGGGIKIRQGSGALIKGNTFKKSGILITSSSVNAHTQNIVIDNNTFRNMQGKGPSGNNGCWGWGICAVDRHGSGSDIRSIAIKNNNFDSSGHILIGRDINCNAFKKTAIAPGQKSSGGVYSSNNNKKYIGNNQCKR